MKENFLFCVSCAYMRDVADFIFLAYSSFENRINRKSAFMDKTIKEKNAPLQTILYGALMGMADTIPGVSGATIAYIVGFYEDFLRTVKSFDLQMLKLFFKGRLKAAFMRPLWHIALPLIFGIFLGFLFFAKVINLPQLVITHPTPIYALFFGLILASIPQLFKGNSFHLLHIIIFIGGILAAFALTYLLPQNIPTSPLFLFICGFLALSAMMLPGVSGSYILLILGQYSIVITAIAEFRVVFLLPFILGAAFSLIFLSRLLSYFMDKFPQKMTFAICGLLVGSLWKIWPFQERSYVFIEGKSKLISSTPILPKALDGETLLSLLSFIGGFLLIIVFQKLASHRQK